MAFNLWNLKDDIVYVFQLREQEEGKLGFIINQEVDWMVEHLCRCFKTRNPTPSMLGVFQEASLCGKLVFKYLVLQTRIDKFSSFSIQNG